MKPAWILLLLFACSSTHELLTPVDGGTDVTERDSAGFDAAGDANADGGDCGPPPPPGAPCLEFVDDRDGVFCCRDEPGVLECRDGSWQCPIGWFEASECTISAPTCPWFECAAMDAHTSPIGVACAGVTFTRYTFDGRACRPLGFGCSFTECVGGDCGSLYEDLDSCVTANADCGAGRCEAMDVRYEGAPTCDAGSEPADYWSWNGWACQRHVDCSEGPINCVGADCGSLYASEAACEVDRTGCIDQCDATDATLTCEGSGGLVFSYVWNGHDCGLVSRCPEEPTCAGSECDQVYDSAEACRAQHRHCIGPAPVADRGAIACGLGEPDIVNAALRLSACGHASANDVIAGYFEMILALPIERSSPGYVPECDLIACGASAGSCAELDACVAIARGSACPAAPLDVCIGTEIWNCGDLSIRKGDCATVGGTCRMEPTSGDREIASCETPGNAAGPWRLGTWCDRDELVVNIGGESVRLACSEYLPGTVCRDIRFAGEIPGVACGYPDPVCSEFQSSTVRCSGTSAELCVGGQPRLIDCIAEGYAGCEDGAGCVE